MSNTHRVVLNVHAFPKWDFYGKVKSRKHQARDRKGSGKNWWRFSNRVRNVRSNLLRKNQELSLAEHLEVYDAVQNS